MFPLQLEDHITCFVQWNVNGSGMSGRDVLLLGRNLKSRAQLVTFPCPVVMIKEKICDDFVNLCPQVNTVRTELLANPRWMCNMSEK